MSLTLPTWPIDEDIYKGFWINRSLGTVRGATLTLDRQTGGLVIAFLALFIAATARSFWKITRFLVYAIESNLGKQDGVYHQRQAILRNQSLALNAVLDLCRLSYAWRDRAKRSQQRILPVILIASAISVGSVAAGLLSSRILTNSNQEVLIAGRNCGIYVSDPDSQLSPLEPLLLYHSQRAVDAFTYAMQCYHRGDTIQNELCETFARPKLPFTSDRNASCPFAGEICKSDFGNILLDSGLLHSQVHLGLNQDPQFTLRHQTHCAPLKTAGFTDTVMAPNSSQARQIYRYGNTYGPDGNGSHIFAVDVRHEKPSFDGWTIGNYKVTALAAISSYKESIELIPELRKPNATVSLLFLDASEVLYVNKTKDPWFSATSLLDSSSFASIANVTHYFAADEPVGVLGCVNQRSFCNPNLPENVGCIDGFAISDPQSSLDLFKSAWPDANDQFAMRAFVVALNTQGAGLLDSYYTLPNSPTLLSRSTVLLNLQVATIPKDRWQDEREHVYKASLAAIQSMMVEHARGFAISGSTLCKGEKMCRRICHSQKMRSSKHYSFSAWTLGVILIVGSTLMLTSAFVEELFALFLRYPRLRSAKLIYSYFEWQAGSTLQLQRLAHENLGLGTWTRTDEAIPVTELGDTLGVLDVTKSKHVRMVIPTEELNRVDSVADSATFNLLDHGVVDN
ncbi:hypothetical protein COCSADRAFT_188049 [Bipolaris sorokiniana ND90Pr]|uniref:Uncharacterized protein n=1 Tax=Cochliobolus sativus (strain ND90Pr / ATCC 201652) TaxID=665912 RepID=M2TDF0_COCSN|nr:uncharacterized protein COCSADRAFT_188049 [Bipolaris sorokiniana ND90Pr]EMD67266.1 hypothetical protein COCSADRAFT_188049 [Bipolaris sorokiniana ND90Pr]